MFVNCTVTQYVVNKRKQKDSHMPTLFMNCTSSWQMSRLVHRTNHNIAPQRSTSWCSNSKKAEDLRRVQSLKTCSITSMVSQPDPLSPTTRHPSDPPPPSGPLRLALLTQSFMTLDSAVTNWLGALARFSAAHIASHNHSVNYSTFSSFRKMNGHIHF